MSVNTFKTGTFRNRPGTLTVKIADLAPGLIRNHRELPDFAALLEEWGADQVVLGQHLVRTGSPHPGGVSLDPRRPALDPFVTLALLASRTSRLGLATGAVIAPLHQPIGLAKAAATLDHLSGGRFELGLVAGWDRVEFTAAGVPFDERFARLDEAIDACRILWRDAPATFQGRWTRVSDAYCLPHPTHVPILVGGRPTEATARRVARRADGWIAGEAAGTDDVRRAVHLLREAMAARGRPFEQLTVRATIPAPAKAERGSSEALLQAADGLVAAGATALTVPLGAWARDTEEAEQLIRALVQERDHGRTGS